MTILNMDARWVLKALPEASIDCIVTDPPYRTINPAGMKSHPTEKPVALMRDLVEASSLPGQVVLDPFCGTGAVGVACRETGRTFIGIEIDPDYAGVARGRV